VVEPALVGVGVCAASVLVAVVLGLLLSRGLEGLFRRGRRDGPSDEDEPAAGNDQPEEADAPSDAEADEAPAEPQEA
jgi:hypothetical protein